MIKGLSSKKLVKEDILDRITEEMIFEKYLGPFKTGVPILSPLREERSPSFVLFEKGNKLLFKDFGSGSSGDCFRFISLRYNISFIQVLELVDRDFCLDLSNTSIQVYREYKPPARIIRKPKPDTIVEVNHRPFTLKELEYWKRHLQTPQSLEKERIYAIREARINGKIAYQNEQEMAFHYLMEDGRSKLYYPERVQGHFKWLGNCKNNHIEGKQDIIRVKNAIVSGSRKERILLKALGLSACNTQNESNTAFTSEFVDWLNNTAENIWVMYDRDKTGLAAMKDLETKYGYKPLIIPDCSDTKDMSQWIYNCGPEEAIQFLKDKNLI